MIVALPTSEHRIGHTPPGAELWAPGAVPPIALVVLIVLVGTCVSIAYHYVMGVYLGFEYPWSTFLFFPKDHFMDYFNVYRHAQEFRPGESSNMVYSPLLHLVMTVLNGVPAWVGFGLMVAAFFVTLVALLWSWTMRLVGNRVVRTVFVATLALLSYPVLIALDRGNLEMLVFIMLAVFFYAYYVRRSPWAWVPLSLAVSAKYYWVTLILLLLLDRQARQAAWCVLGTVSVTMVSMLVVAATSGYSVLEVGKGLSTTLSGHADATGALFAAAHNHSLWDWVICIHRWSDYALYWLPLQRVYLLTAVLILMLVILRITRGGFTDWQKATALVACTLVLPYESRDYTLIQILLPLTLFAATWRRGRVAWAAAALFGLLLIPLDYYYFTFVYWRSWVSTAALAYPLLLLGLIVVALWNRHAGDHGATSGDTSGSPDGFAGQGATAEPRTTG